MSTHTPGPWRVGCQHCDESNAIVAMAHVHVASVRRLQPTLDTEREANARLIAAAPDLLAALEAVWKWAEHDSEQRAIAAELGVGEWEAFMPPWAEQARAAIAKAREVKP